MLNLVSPLCSPLLSTIFSSSFSLCSLWPFETHSLSLLCHFLVSTAGFRLIYVSAPSMFFFFFISVIAVSISTSASSFLSQLSSFLYSILYFCRCFLLHLSDFLPPVPRFSLSISISVSLLSPLPDLNFFRLLNPFLSLAHCVRFSATFLDFLLIYSFHSSTVSFLCVLTFLGLFCSLLL